MKKNLLLFMFLLLVVSGCGSVVDIESNYVDFITAIEQNDAAYLGGLGLSGFSEFISEHEFSQILFRDKFVSTWSDISIYEDNSPFLIIDFVTFDLVSGEKIMGSVGTSYDETAENTKPGFGKLVSFVSSMAYFENSDIVVTLTDISWDKISIIADKNLVYEFADVYHGDTLVCEYVPVEVNEVDNDVDGEGYVLFIPCDFTQKDTSLKVIFETGQILHIYVGN